MAEKKGKVIWLRDGLRNLVANLGTTRDKANASEYVADQLTPGQLQEMYRAAWLPQKIVDVVAKDACRNWREWNADADQILMIEKREKELKLRGHVLDAMRKARLFGGAAIYIGTDKGMTPEAPLELTEKIQHLTVITSNQLTAGDLEKDVSSPFFGSPGMYTIADTHVQIHPSRLILFYGNTIPDESLAVSSNMTQGWGDSILLAVRQAVRDADSTTSNIASLIFEAKVDVIKIPDFMANLDDPEYEKAVLARLELAATAKGINGALLLDSAEEYEQKSASFANLKDLIFGMMQVVSGASDIPMTRLLGMSPGGLNSTGESDTRNYYDHVSGIQELQVGPAMALFDKLMITETLGADAAEELDYDWRGLWQPTAKEEADIGKQVADTIKTLNDTDLFDPDTLGEASIALLADKGVMNGLKPSDMEDDDEQDEDDIEGESALFDGVPRPLYVSRKVLNVSDFQKWARKQGLKLVDDLHVTIAFSRTPVDWMSVRQTWDNEKDGKMHIEPGGPRDMDTYGNGEVLVLEFASRSLKWRHQDMKEAGASWDWDKYQPHITVAKASENTLDGVEAYQGPIVLGPEIFEDLNPKYITKQQ